MCVTLFWGWHANNGRDSERRADLVALGDVDRLRNFSRYGRRPRAAWGYAATVAARWHLSDAQAGILFFLFFIGSASGAVLSRGSLPKSIARGCLLVVIGSALLAVASRGAVFLAITVYGLGLGIVMTSISLLQSRRYESGVLLSWLV